ncbi:MAG: penicillin-binding protein 1A [Robiginitomaculum sp.]|nr:penicillin-binding protein 1A [Robiginitomaculum sp.]
MPGRGTKKPSTTARPRRRGTTARKRPPTIGRPARPNTGNRRRRKRKPAAGKWRRAFGQMFYWGMVASLWIGLISGAGLLLLASNLPDTSSLWEVERQPSITYVDIKGRQIAVRGAAYAPPVHVDELPPHLVDAVLAIEDRRFYHHFGVDPIGLARAMFTNVRRGGVVQGGSTLTQQLAKNLFLTNDRTYKRKAQEVLLAFWLESRFSKKEILSLYLNRVYFGRGAWGVEAAAQRYFGKPATELNLGESAMIAGLLKAPNRYSPTADLARAERRATVVLDVMVKSKKITAAEREAAFAQPVHVRRSQASPAASYFVDWLAPKVRELSGDVDADLLIETTLDLDDQRAAERAILTALDAKAKARGATQGAMVALNADGAVRAMAGGVSYARSQFNRATQARRQPGSAFKPFVYLAAIEAGLSPWTVREDAPVRIGDWQPQNYSGKYAGDMALITALAKSVNTVAVRVANEVGRDRIAEAAHRLGFTSPIGLTRSMPLGSNETSLIELTSAYAPFANGGVLARPYGLVRISTREGDVLWTHKTPPRKVVLDPRTYALMNVMLERVMSDGTGRRARLTDRPSAGKTGTTNDFRDAWFAGYASGHIAGVWVGDDKNRAMKKITGGSLPAQIWHAYMVQALKDVPPSAPAAVPPTPGVAIATRSPSPQSQARVEASPRSDDPLGDLLGSLGE